MTMPQFREWCEYGGGVAIVSRLRIKWAIEDAAERAQYAKQAARRRGPPGPDWQGGEADPHDSAIFEDAED